MPINAGQDIDIQDSPVDVKELVEEINMLRLEIDLIRRQIVGIPVERLIEGFVYDGVLEEHLARYRFAAKHLTGKVMDMACGIGHGSNLMVNSPEIESVTGIDVDDKVVRYARRKYTHPKLQYFCYDACGMIDLGVFDGIASFETIEHVPHPDKMLNNIVNLLNPNGCLVISTPVRPAGKLSDKPKWYFHEREWSFDEFKDLLSLYFDEIELFGQQWYIQQDFGPIHFGKRLIKKLMQMSGINDSIINGLDNEVFSPNELPLKWLKPMPHYTVCVCRKPHLSSNMELLKKLCYG